MELLSADVEFLESLATELRSRTSDNGRLNRQFLRTAPFSLQRRVVRQFLQQSLNFNPNFEQIEKVVALIQAPNRSRTDPFVGGAIAEVQGDWIQITPGIIQESSSEQSGWG
jgi:tRNA(Ile)-lysidine synthase